MCALPWSEASLTAPWMRISAQTVEVAYHMYDEAPKADSVRTISMTEESGRVLAAHRVAQDTERAEWSGENA